MTRRDLPPSPRVAALALGVIDRVYVFHAPTLLTEQRARGVKTRVAASVLKAHWNAAEIYPVASNPLLPLRELEAELLRLFASP
jgi:hypothetical protein